MIHRAEVETMTKKIFPMVLGAVLLFAGCMGTPTDPETAREQEDGPQDYGREGERRPDGPTDATITLGADVAEGAVPLTVVFFLDSTGLDGFNLSWTLDATGDGDVDAQGDSLPSNETHTYVQPGQYLATLTVQVADQDTETSLVVDVAPLETWYLMWSEDEDDPLECGESSMNRNHTGESAECNENGAALSKVATMAGKPVWATFTASEPTYGFPSGTPIEGTLHLASVGAGTGNLTVQLLADGDVVAESIQEVDDAPGLPEPGETTRNTTYLFDMNTEARIAKNAVLSFRIALNTLEHWHLRTNAESPNGFTIGGPYEHG